MANTPSDFPKHILTAAKATFNKEYAQPVDNTFRDLCTEVTSTSAKEIYAAIGATAPMREWKSGRQPRELKEFGFEIVNKDWEASVRIHQNAIDDDQLGGIMLSIKDMANEATRHKGELAMQTIVAGTETECYDGQYFFDTDHAEGDSGTQSNKLTNELTSANLAIARAKMMRFKNDKGKPMNIIADSLVVPPELEKTALELVGSPNVERYVASGTDSQPTINVHQGKYKVITNPFITDVDSWYLGCTKRPTKPLILQNRRELRFDVLGGPEKATETWYNTGFIDMGVSARYNIGPGNWRLMIANIPA